MKTGSDNEELTPLLVGGNCLSAQAAAVRSSLAVRSAGQTPQSITVRTMSEVILCSVIMRGEAST